MKKKYFLIISLLCLIVFLILLYVFRNNTSKIDKGELKSYPVVVSSDLERVDEKNLKEDSNKANDVQAPLSNPDERILKKKFGTFVAPEDSPVDPERFRGYHTGTDFEILSGEEDLEIMIQAVCSGEVVGKRHASGYGGVVIQSCEIEGKPVTVVYGHLELESIDKKVGENIEKGEKLGILGKGYSQKTDGERKHLHLGIHKGSEINILGYVQDKKMLNDWIDPCLYICKK